MSDYLGYLASTLVLWTFCTRTMLPLRVSAIASNVAFIAYGALLHLYPVLVLHVVLLPLNTWRLTEIFRLSRPARDAAAADEAFRGLLPLAKRITARCGETVIHEGDVADALYLVIEGVLWVDGVEAEVGPGSIISEIGVLSRTHLRTTTVEARSDCLLGCVSAQDFHRFYLANPRLGLSLVQLIIDRLTRGLETRQLEAVEA
jgi:CRP/FNR family transcriptional regulator, cyclic AMP receptor protein